ncbi:MAG: DUF975 family protein [Flavobacteriaceae bacterium]
MSTQNSELMKIAKDSLTGKWGLAVGTFLIYTLITVALEMLGQDYPSVSLVSLILAGPFTLGIAIFSLNLSRDTKAETNQIFEGFKNFGNAIGAYLLMVLFIFLWTLLLIIPGIIAAISYSMTFFIIAENPDIKPMEAIDKSKAMMDGYKLKYFYLGLRLFGLGLLCILTLGIGFLWLIPYANVCVAKFYDDVKNNQN